MTPMLLLLALCLPAYADVLNFFFSSNQTCPEIPWACVQNNVLAACAYDTIVDRYYCCGAAAQATCRTTVVSCAGENGGPSSTQQLCTSGESTWCCLKGYEQCTPRPGQIDVCISTAQDAIGNVSQKILEDTFSSLSSASPQATSFNFDATSLSIRAAALSTASSTTSSRTSPITPSTTSSTTSSNSPKATTGSLGISNDLSRAAIAGIVVGSIAGIAAIVGAIILVRRRKRRSRSQSQHTTYDAQPRFNRLLDMGYTYPRATQDNIRGAHHHHRNAEMGDTGLKELYSEAYVNELQG